MNRVLMHFPDDPTETELRVPWGAELEAWHDAIAQRNRIRQSNEDQTLAVVAVAGFIASDSASARSLRGLGGVASASAITGLLARSVDGAKHSLFPRSHLLAEPIPVPPKLFAKRWILLNTGGREGAPCIDSTVLTFELADGRSEAAHLRYKGASEWQRAACNRGTAARQTH